MHLSGTINVRGYAMSPMAGKMDTTARASKTMAMDMIKHWTEKGFFSPILKCPTCGARETEIKAHFRSLYRFKNQ